MQALSHQLRALALLLDYPQAEACEHLDALAAVLAPLAAAGALPALFEAWRGDLMDLQSLYIETFDRGRSTSLNLFEHVHGDSRDRGQAMVDLLAQYARAGLELQARQLPDYLPVYLEYASALEPAAARAALADVAPLLAALAAALERRRSPWLGALDTLCRLAGDPDWRAASGAAPDDASAQSLDDAWAEAPVDFLGACAPHPRGGDAQPLQFVARAASPAPAGV
jgi:nitrate reductase delta subunit